MTKNDSVGCMIVPTHYTMLYLLLTWQPSAWSTLSSASWSFLEPPPEGWCTSLQCPDALAVKRGISACIEGNSGHVKNIHKRANVMS